MSRILNKSKIITANVFLTDTDVSNLQLSYLYYIKQLNGYFILNKLINYIGRGKTKCELIKVDYTPNSLTSGDIILKIKTVQKLATLDITIVYDNTAFHLQI